MAKIDDLLTDLPMRDDEARKRRRQEVRRSISRQVRYTKEQRRKMRNEALIINAAVRLFADDKDEP